MTQKATDLTTEVKPSDSDLKLLTEIGYTSSLRGLGIDMEPVFQALRIERPDNAAGAIGHALQALTAKDFDRAIDILERDGITAKLAANEARSVLTLALKLAGRNREAADVAAQIGNTGSYAKKFASRVTATEAVA